MSLRSPSFAASIAAVDLSLPELFSAGMDDADAMDADLLQLAGHGLTDLRSRQRRSPGAAMRMATVMRCHGSVAREDLFAAQVSRKSIEDGAELRAA